MASVIPLFIINISRTTGLMSPFSDYAVKSFSHCLISGFNIS